MNDDILKTIKTENYIWILYIFIIILCFYANNQEVKYYKYNDQIAKEKYYYSNLIVFSLVFIVYLYFFISSLNSVSKLDSNSSKEKVFYERLNLLGTSFILIAGFIFLYIAITDTNLETEIAFN